MKIEKKAIGFKLAKEKRCQKENRSEAQGSIPREFGGDRPKPSFPPFFCSLDFFGAFLRPGKKPAENNSKPEGKCQSLESQRNREEGAKKSPDITVRAQ